MVAAMPTYRSKTTTQRRKTGSDVLWRKTLRSALTPMAAFAFLSTALAQSHTHEEALQACKHLEGHVECHGACVQWYQSDNPSEDQELIERGTTCWRADRTWEGFTPRADEDVVVQGERVTPIVFLPSSSSSSSSTPQPEVLPQPTTQTNPTPPATTPSAGRQEPEFVAPNKETLDILACIRSRSPGDELLTGIANTRISFLYGDLGGVSALTTPVNELPGFEDEPDNHYAIAFDRSEIADRADVSGHSEP